MSDTTDGAPDADRSVERQLRDMNEALLISSVKQHELADRAEKAEAALRESEQRVRLALDSADLGTFHIDPATKTLTSDARLRAIFGSADERLEYEQAFAAIHPDDQLRIREAGAAATRLDDPVPFEAEFRVVQPDRSIRWVFAKGRTNFTGQGSVRKLLSFDGTVADITVRAAMEQQIKAQALTLAEQDRRKDEFMAMLSHELRNPLAPIRSAVHILRLQTDGTENSLQRQARETIERQVGILTRLVDDLMEVSRVVSGKIRIIMVTVDLCEAVRQALDTVTPVMARRGHQVSVALPDGPVWVNADPTRLEQVIVNLLHNAAKFTAEGGRIQLSVARHHGQVELRVGDSGIGIAPEMLEHVFDLFAQADRSLSRSDGGLGIGLSLVHRLVALHGGTVEAKSSGIHQGSEFIVRLPVALMPNELSDHAASLLEDHCTKALRVLVVDDNIDARTMLAAFAKLKGHDVVTASSGPAAIATATNWRPDVVLLDIGLPGLSGFDVARQLRADPANKAMKLVAVSGYGREQDLELGREAGFDLHLVKPIDLTVVEQLLANVANQPSR